MQKAAIGVAVAVLVLACAYYVWQLYGTVKNAEPTSTVTEPMLRTYATSTFSLQYPDDFTLDEQYAYTQVNPKKPISGVKFTIPGAMATGTNLASDSYISVEWLPRAKNCTGDIYLFANVKPTTLSTASTTYSLATATGAAAGSTYEEQVYAISSSKPCTAVRYFIHSSNIGNYDPGAVKEFDRDTLLRAFDSIRDSLSLTESSSNSTQTP